RDLEARRAAAATVGNFHLDFLVVHLALAQLLAEAVAGGGTGRLADQRLEHTLFGVEVRARLHVFAHFLARQADGGLHEVADDLLHVAADIADFGELGRLYFDEWRTRQLCQAARDFRLADAGRPDHQDVLRHHLFAHLAVKLQTAP